MLTATASCDLLQQDSPQDFSPDDVFGSPARVEKAAVGMYDAMQDGSFLGSRALIYNDVRSDDVDPPGAFSSLAFGNITSGDGFALGAWAGGYRSMYMANYMIRELTKRGGEGLTPEKYNQYIGEAKFLRALCHFTLVNMYAKPYKFTPDASHLGIPIQLQAPDGTEAYEPDQRLGRSSVAAVYQQVEQDLLDAIDALPEVHGGVEVNVSRATKDAARGLLSRVYLYKGDYAGAARLAKQVIDGGRHQLNSSSYNEFKSVAGGDQTITNESIFFIAMSQNDNPNTNAAIGQHYAPNTGDISVGPLRLAMDSASVGGQQDRRRADFIVLRSQRYWTRKYASEITPGSIATSSNRGAWIPIVRYPEILLTYAEAVAEQSGGFPTDTLAVHAYNLVRNRSRPNNTVPYNVARATTALGSNRTTFINAVLRERRFELHAEGHRLFDLFRRGKSVPAHGVTARVERLEWGSNRSVLPIPSDEIARNPNLVQNDGY